ncbi:MAG TPA: oxidoreductase [Dehalococcoidia bacterium]|nr:oxidoreductase [Dehalococcoidia bacterium]
MTTTTTSKPRRTTKQRDIPVPDPTLTPEGMIERARALRELLRSKQAETEQTGRILDEVNKKCIAAGFYRTLQPRRFGGYEFDLPTFVKTMIELSRGCPSTGWVVTFTAGHTHVFAKYPEQTQIEAYGKDGEFRAPLVGGQAAMARKVDGGFVISGTWDYASGIDAATHFFGSAPIRDSMEEPSKGLALALFDRDQIEIEHNWEMLGMQGTGSNRVIARDVFVPSQRVHERNLLMPVTTPPEERLFDNPMYTGPSTNILMAEIAAVAVGTGFAALDCFEEVLKRRTAPRSTRIRAEDREFQVYFGEALATLETAQAALLGCTQRFMDYCRDEVAGTRPFTPEMSARIVLVEQQCCRMAGDAVNLMFRMAGTSQAKPGGQMQRYWRDISTLLTHVTLAYDRNYEAVTKQHFGLDMPPEAASAAASDRA